jgi:hypothetical protein
MGQSEIGNLIGNGAADPPSFLLPSRAEAECNMSLLQHVHAYSHLTLGFQSAGCTAEAVEAKGITVLGRLHSHHRLYQQDIK